MKRIIIHWTGGTNQPNSTDFQHYHYLINSDGLTVGGKFYVSDNEVCKSDSKGHALYAAHCGGGNTGSIGVSLCGMKDFNGKPESTNYPLTAVQCEAAFKFIAELCIKHPKTLSYGKPDITFLHPYPWVKKNEVGNFIRGKVRWYYLK